MITNELDTCNGNVNRLEFMAVPIEPQAGGLPPFLPKFAWTSLDINSHSKIKSERNEIPDLSNSLDQKFKTDIWLNQQRKNTFENKPFNEATEFEFASPLCNRYEPRKLKEAYAELKCDIRLHTRAKNRQLNPLTRCKEISEVYIPHNLKSRSEKLNYLNTKLGELKTEKKQMKMALLCCDSI